VPARGAAGAALILRTAYFGNAVTGAAPAAVVISVPGWLSVGAACVQDRSLAGV